MQRLLESFEAQFHENRQLRYALLAAVTLLAAGLRFWKLGFWSYWVDEIFTVNRALVHVNWDRTLAEWWHPSINVILTAGALKILGITEWSARVIPALVGTATIPILYAPVTRLFGPVVGLLTSLLLSVAPWHVEWSQKARNYPSLLLLYFLAAYVFLLAIERDRPRYFLLFVILLLLALGERFSAGFLVPVLVVYLVSLPFLPFGTPAGINARNITLLAVPGLAFALIEVGRFVTTGTSYVLESVALTYSSPIHDPFRLAAFIGFDIGLPLMAFALFTGIYLLVQKNRTGLYILLNALVPIAVLLLMNRFYFTQDRYAFMVLPFWLILAAIGMQELYRHARGSGKIIAAGVLVLLLADAAGANLLYYGVNHGNRHDWKSALSLVRERSRPDDQYVSWWTQFGPHYLDRPMLDWGEITPSVVEGANNRFWFILDEETIWGNGLMKRWIEEHAELIDIRYLRRQRDQHLRIYLYDPAR